MLFNLIIFIMVVISLKRSHGNKNKHAHSPDVFAQLRIAASCCTLLGLTWLFGVLAIADARLPFQYLFCIFNSLQGAFIFYFNIVRQSRVKTAWLNYLSGKGRSYEISSNISTFRIKTTKSQIPPSPPTPTPLRMSSMQGYLCSESPMSDNGTLRSEISFMSYMDRNSALY